MSTKVKDLMKEDPEIISSNTTLKKAAQKMESIDCGVLPVGTWDNLEGIITDRDIVVRAVANGVDVNTSTVSDYMTEEVFFCNENDTLEEAAEQMRKHSVSRLVVNNKNNKASGIITFGCIMRENPSLKEIGKIVECAIGEKAA